MGVSASYLETRVCVATSQVSPAPALYRRRGGFVKIRQGFLDAGRDIIDKVVHTRWWACIRRGRCPHREGPGHEKNPSWVRPGP